MLLCALPAVAKDKKSKEDKKSKKSSMMSAIQKTGAQQRIDQLSGEDHRRFDSLSDHQKEKIAKGEIEEGFNEWMVKLAYGDPYYATEHHPKFVDYEEVWLYTKPEVTDDVNEERILDPVNNNWPTVHRTTHKKRCQVSDFFVLWDRGVVQSVHPDTERKTFGTCTIETQEAFLPIVDGKPVEPKK